MGYYRSNELYHHGIKGQRWGVRRYQNEDGSLTDAGRKRYGEHGADYLKAKKDYQKANRAAKRSRKLAAAGNFVATRDPRLLTFMARGMALQRAGARTAQANKLKKDYIRAKYTRDYETGRRKQLNGKYQPDVEDEIKYGRKESERIAKRRNRGMSNAKAHRVTTDKIRAKNIAKYGVRALITADLALNRGRGTRKVLATGLKGGIILVSDVARGARAAKGVYNNYYNTSILDSSGRVITRYHDTASWGEAVVSGLLHS